MKAGIPISKLDCFCDLLTEDAFSQTNSQHLWELIPIVHMEQKDKIKESISGRQISDIFDGTTHVAEAIVIVVRYINDEWEICQKVARLMLIAHSMTGDEVARQLISINKFSKAWIGLFSRSLKTKPFRRRKRIIMRKMDHYGLSDFKNQS